MKEIIPYKKEIVFNTKIAEIVSISLEYEANILDNEISGDFIVSGLYRVHEVSVNKEPFKYRLPFCVELSDNIIRDSIKHDINNFTYEVSGDDTLVVSIEFLVEGEEVKVEDVVIEEEKEVKEDEREEIKEMNREVDEEIKDINDSIINNEIIKEDNDNSSININSNNNDSKKDIVLNNINNADNTYIVYHIYVLNDTDTLDSIATKFNVSKDLILEYNGNAALKAGDSVLIPELKDE